MAMMSSELYQLNIAKIVVIDVTDDYRLLMDPPLPNDWYPVLKELCVPAYDLERWLHEGTLVEGYLYDWHSGPSDEDGPYYVGVVDQGLAREPGPH
ncbi:MAG: hypothetical protein IT207_06570 [Fimbriimonadaceae bacterium]|nr:hypothetical protein [Fimbriimonadaceae bacterium]